MQCLAYAVTRPIPWQHEGHSLAPRGICYLHDTLCHLLLGAGRIVCAPTGAVIYGNGVDGVASGRRVREQVHRACVAVSEARCLQSYLLKALTFFSGAKELAFCMSWVMHTCTAGITVARAGLCVCV